MSRPDFGILRKQLLEAGISPRRTYRAITELNDHFDDIVDAAMADGRSRAEAERIATEALGELSEVSAAMAQQPQLKSWAWHHPRLALLVYPLACLAALPAVPLIAGVQHASEIGRWLTCLALGAFVTALMFLVLQLSILLA
ncbi:MAG: hypothetical protein R3358_01240 [Woeseiaceae bacterium]|nr:hypothetical protein [Woeseiaceae bacterium]